LKIAIATVQVPFITGGAEVLASDLKRQLIARDIQTEIVSVPFQWYPSDKLINSMLMGRMMDITEVNGEKIDLVIAMKFPAYYLRHVNKVIWLCHQHRQAYDLWETPFSDMHLWSDGDFIRNTIRKNDTLYLNEAKKIFTISNNVSKRLKKYNNIEATTLYPPPQHYDKFICKEYDNFIFYPSRIDPMKRQRILVESAIYLKYDTKIYIAGAGSQEEVAYLESFVIKNKLENKVKLLGFISEKDKLDYYSRCLCVYFGAYDEDYGYITLEALSSRKPIIVHTDAGGPLEFVEDMKNGFVVEPNPISVAKKINELASNTERARKMGELGHRTLSEKNINWDHLIDKLTL
jgi:glycosyltransferase involved in cell wall biosynthesis